MIDEIFAYRVVTSGRKCYFELGADPIDTGDKHRLFVLLGVERKQAAEAADFTQHFTAMSGSEQLRKCGFDRLPRSMSTPARL